MSKANYQIDNLTMRKLLLWNYGLLESSFYPQGYDGDLKNEDWVSHCIKHLGYVQIDPISAVEKAHYHILFSRNKSFQKSWLTDSLEKKRQLFENWTHDACILSMETFPYWKHYFQRFKNKEIHRGYERYFAPVKPAFLKKLLKHIQDNGELRPSDFKSEVIVWDDAYASRTSLAKLGAEYLWRIGELCVTRRQGQMKVYDLPERVVPQFIRDKSVSLDDTNAIIGSLVSNVAPALIALFVVSLIPLVYNRFFKKSAAVAEGAAD